MLKGEQADGGQAQRSLLSYGRDQAEPRFERTRDSRSPTGVASQDRNHSVRDRRESRRRARVDAVDVPPQVERDANAVAETAATRGAWETFADTHRGDEPFHIARRQADDGVSARKPEDGKGPPLRLPETEAEAAPRVDAPLAPKAESAAAAVNGPIDRLVPQSERDRAAAVDPLRSAILGSKRLIVATSILGAVAGIGIALATPKKYEAIAELLTAPRDLTASERDAPAAGLPMDATLAGIENEVAVLMSSTVLTQVAEKLNLAADPEFNGQKHSVSVGAFIAELRALLTGSGGDDAMRKDAAAVESLARSLTVERGSKAFVINVGVSTESADKSALIANTMADTFLQNYDQIRSQTADKRTVGLDALRKDFEEAERKVTAFKAENGIADTQGGLGADDDVGRLNEQLSMARARTLELNARAAAVRDLDVDSVLGGAFPEGLTDDVITQLRAQFTTAKQAADRLAVRLGPRHPERQAAEAQLSGARDQIADELRQMTSSIQAELKRSVEVEQQLAQRLAQLKVRSGEDGGKFVQLRELERAVTTKRAAYDAQLQRAKDANEQGGISTAGMTLISPAYPPLEPAAPSRGLMALAGLFLGFASGVGLAAMRGASNALGRRRHDEGQPSLLAGGETPTPDGRPGAEARDRQTSPPADTRSYAAPSAQTAKPEHPSTPGVTTEDKSMRHRYADPHQAWNSAVPDSQPDQRGWPVPQQPMPAGYASYPPGQPMPGSYPQPMPPLPAYHAAPPAYPHPVPAPFHGYDQRGYPQPPMPQAYPPYGMAPPAQVYPAYASAYPMPEMHHAPVAGYRPPEMANVIAYPDRYMRADMPTAHYAEERASSRAIEEIRASLAEFREAVRDLTESRQKRRFF